LRTELGWTPNYVDFRAGLAATIDWYRDNTDWWQPAKDAVEQKYAATERDCRENGVSGLTALGVSGAGRSHHDRHSGGCGAI
ncbi:dTDP-glucose 4,6-dehydratase, partial [Gordonia rubripertincta]|nr:dTDP-glucose 4,6-dehydratase [Gordonia rubripertincta]